MVLHKWIKNTSNSILILLENIRLKNTHAKLMLNCVA